MYLKLEKILLDSRFIKHSYTTTTDRNLNKKWEVDKLSAGHGSNRKYGNDEHCCQAFICLPIAGTSAATSAAKDGGSAPPSSLTGDLSRTKTSLYYCFQNHEPPTRPRAQRDRRVSRGYVQRVF
ncbi:hypothetical protein ACJJTC_006707 [Scirpophaga incertulas]